MDPSAQSGTPSLDTRLRSHLSWCRAIVCMLTGAITIVFYVVALIDEQSAWLTFLRPVLASGLLTCVIVENAIRAANFPPLPTQTPDSDIAEKEQKKQPDWRIRFDALIARWKPHLSQLGVTAVCSFIAILLVSTNLSFSAETAQPVGSVIPAVVILLVGCFALLVYERTLHLRRTANWAHQNALVGLLRALLSVGLLVTSAVILSTFSPTLAFWVVWIASLLVFLLAVEFLLRALTATLDLSAPDNPPRFLTQSLVAEQYRWPVQPLLMLRKKIMQHFGVDLGNIQAFRLTGKIFLPVVCGITLTGWLVSGFHEVSPTQRGVYERFGRPVSVLPPGLHIGLPWPFGQVRQVDFGAVHELQLSETSPEQNTNDVITDPIEGPAPQESWRLWDNTHNTDQAQVIASAMGDKQSFQIVNMDIRLIWRVGMRDKDAMDSLYQNDDLPTTLQRIARQVLTQYFAHQQLDALLNEQRASMSAAMNAEIQRRLDRLHTGVELLYTRVESIHPPAGAARAYHGVQAAQITADTQIAKEKGYAASQNKAAQRKATTAIDEAEAAADERVAQANMALTRYSAEYNAWRLNPDAFLAEQRYQTYSKALARTPLLILDSQLAKGNDPILDLRQFSQTSR